MNDTKPLMENRDSAPQKTCSIFENQYENEP